jgi:hypothetical protein
MSVMGTLIHLADWRDHASPGPEQTPSLARLDAAVERLHVAVEGVAAPDGSVDRRTETEILAIIGELAAGSVDGAVQRAERLTERLRVRRRAEA